jgi:hypothetical protein
MGGNYDDRRPSRSAAYVYRAFTCPRESDDVSRRLRNEREGNAERRATDQFWISTSLFSSDSFSP